MIHAGRPKTRTAHLRTTICTALDAKCYGRRAEFLRRHLPALDQQEYYRALRGEPVRPEVVLEIERAVQQS
jgi:hypothetical protein